LHDNPRQRGCHCDRVSRTDLHRTAAHGNRDCHTVTYRNSNADEHPDALPNRHADSDA